MSPSNARPQISTQKINSKTASEKSRLKKPIEEVSGIPVCDENDEPAFIVEIELWKPYAQKRSPEYLHERITAYFTPKGNASVKGMTLALAEDNFADAIEAFSSVIRNEYQNFLMEKKNEDFFRENLEIFFYDRFSRTSGFQNVKTTLEDRVLHYVCEKFGNLSDLKDVIPSVYGDLVEKTHEVINECVTELRQYSKTFRVCRSASAVSRSI